MYSKVRVLYCTLVYRVVYTLYSTVCMVLKYMKDYMTQAQETHMGQSQRETDQTILKLSKTVSADYEGAPFALQQIH